MITKEEKQKMLSIAKPFMIDGCADPLVKENYMTLLNRIENNKSEVGNIILECMFLAYCEGLKRMKEVQKR